MIPYEQLVAIANDDDFVTHDGLMFRLNGQECVRYVKRDYVLRPGIWRGQHQDSALKLCLSRAARTFVVGHSDYSFSDRVWLPLRLAGAQQVLACNTTTRSPRVQPLPLGLTNDCDDGPRHRLLGDRRPIRSVILEGAPSVPYRGSLYSNFDVTTHPSRRRLQQVLKGLPNHSGVRPEYTPAGRQAYLRALRDSNFVVCPRGNGIDTHRLWETLYVGGIPIVEDFPRAKELLHGLPVIIVSDWSLLADKEFLSRAWEEVHDSTHDSERLTLSYYAVLARRLAS